MSRCRSCGAEIVWGKSVNGKAMPLDAQPSDDGNCELTPDGRVVVHAQPVRGGRRAHHSTCPTVEQHRKPRKP